MPNGHILVVDDEPDLVRALTIRLRAAGYRVTAAVDAVGAVAAFLDDRPDLVLLDLVLPTADGHAVLERLQGLDRASAPPVVCLTASTAVEERRRALAAGAVAFLTKPFDGRELLATIAGHLAASREIDAVAAG